MGKKIIYLGILLLFVLCLIGCTEEETTPITEGLVSISITDVVLTNELEMPNVLTNETNIEISNDTHYLILTLNLQNNNDRWLEIQAPLINGCLFDTLGTKYSAKVSIAINNITYFVDQLALVETDEAFNLKVDIPADTTTTKKIVFSLPIEREPEKMRLSYGFKDTQEELVTDWYNTILTIDPTMET